MTNQRKTICITGASSGLGAALAEIYARGKARLVLTGRDAERLQTVAKRCEQLGAEVHTSVLDVRARDLTQQYLTQMDHRYPFDILIANAGISGGMGGIDEKDIMAQGYEVFETNLTGVLHTIDPIIPRMIARGRGHAVLMSSLVSYSPWPGAPAYAASKAAVRFYGEALAQTLKPHGVNVSVICPGFVRTPMTDRNPYRMPLLMDTEKAARLMKAGLDKKKRLIVYPFLTAFIAQLMGMIHSSVMTHFLAKTPQKPALPDQL
ncbi:MAG: SDR family NAD(P)-dependent oxidoreductase [Alphaproteobacteria bacterium]|nr:SDR family NAD(P)-dependent oxidoreductase [Alphaproteobacteria bacterium]